MLRCTVNQTVGGSSAPWTRHQSMDGWWCLCLFLDHHNKWFMQMSLKCNLQSHMYTQTHTQTQNNRRKAKVNERCVAHLVLCRPPQMQALIISSFFLSCLKAPCCQAPSCLSYQAPLPVDTTNRLSSYRDKRCQTADCLVCGLCLLNNVLK